MRQTGRVKPGLRGIGQDIGLDGGKPGALFSHLDIAQFYLPAIAVITACFTVLISTAKALGTEANAFGLWQRVI